MLARQVSVLAIGVLFFVGARAQDPHASHSLGHVDFAVSCSPPAQNQFDQAMALLHHMTYPQAREAFVKLSQDHPTCAMAHWGIAMTLFQPLWPTRPSPSALRRGWEEVQRAKSQPPTSERERLFIAAGEAFFAAPESPDYWLRIRRWEEASKQAYDALPNDTEAALFYALAHLATTPAQGNPRAHADESAQILVKVYGGHPDHPGAMHYLLHANDVPGRERELLDVTRKYEEIAPNNPHALHMPTHIYTRLGDWDAVIRGNLRAADAALLHPAGDQGEYVWDEFAHAIEYLVYAYLQQGADEAARTQLARLRATPNLEPSFKTAFHLMSTQSRYALERRDWREAARIVPRTPASLDWDRFPWAEATARFARGLGAAHLGNRDDARLEVARLELLENGASKAGEDLFARSIRVLRLELVAWLAHVNGERARSLDVMREAAALEAATPKHAVTPGPTLPASELLGDLYTELDQPNEALTAYEAALELYPRRFHSLLGAARAATALHDEAKSRDLYATFIDVAASGSRKAAVAEARERASVYNADQ